MMQRNFEMHTLLNLTSRVRVSCYTFSVGARCNSAIIVKSSSTMSPMILEADMPLEQIDEALKHLSESIRVARNINRKMALLDLVDALLDAKLEKTEGNQ